MLHLHYHDRFRLRLILSCICILWLSSSALAQSTWKHYDSLSISGIERIAGGKERPFLVARSNGKLQFTTQRGLDGSLIGENRNEESVASGVFTWLSDSPKWVLQLPETSIAEYGSLIQPSRFSKGALLEARQTIERSLGKKVIQFKSGTYRDRTCFEVTVGDPNLPTNFQKLWIDAETGITLQRIDTSNRSVDYQYKLDSFKPDQIPANGAFALAPSATVIRGFVHPEILKHAGEKATDEDYKKALAGITAVDRNSILSVPKPEGFEYVHTLVSTARGSGAGKVQTGGALGSALLLPGGLPPGWNVTGDVDVEKGTIVMDFVTPEGGGPKAMINLPSGVQDSATFQIKITNDQPNSDPIDIQYVSFVDTNGSLIIAPGDSVQAAKERRKAEAILFGSSVIHTDFLDPKSGDSVSFVQIRNRQLTSVFKANGLTAQKPIEHQKLGEIKVYRLEKPFTAIVLSWKRGEVIYALTSTRLKVDDLIAIAEKAAPAR
jgi:hypothetical protein